MFRPCVDNITDLRLAPTHLARLGFGHGMDPTATSHHRVFSRRMKRAEIIFVIYRVLSKIRVFGNLECNFFIEMFRHFRLAVAVNVPSAIFASIHHSTPGLPRAERGMKWAGEIGPAS